MVVEGTRYKVPSTKYFLNERSISKEKDHLLIKNRISISLEKPTWYLVLGTSYSFSRLDTCY